MYTKAEVTTNAKINFDMLYRASVEELANNEGGKYVSAFVYDTRFDSDRGEWTDKNLNTSAYRAADTGLRSDRRGFPPIAYILAETDAVTIKDVSDPELATWFRFSVPLTTFKDGLLYKGGIKKVAALNGYIFILCSSVLYILDLLLDSVHVIDTNNSYRREGPGIGYANQGVWENTTIFGDDGQFCLPSAKMKNMSICLSPLSVTNQLRGLPAPTVSLISEDGKVCIINPYVSDETWETASWVDDSWTYGGSISMVSSGLVAFTAGSSFSAQNIHFVYLSNPKYRSGSTEGVKDVDNIISNRRPGMIVDSRKLLDLAMHDGSSFTAITPDRIYTFALNEGNTDQSRMLLASSTDYSGWMFGDCVFSWIGSNSLLRDASAYDNELKITGSLDYEPTETGSDLKMASGFNKTNFLWAISNPFTSMGNRDWMISFVVGSINGVVGMEGATVGALTNQTILEFATWNGEAYVGPGLRIYIDGNSKLRCSLTTNGWLTQSITPVADGAAVAANQLHHICIARHRGKVYLFMNGSVASFVAFDKDLTNTTAMWRIGVRGDGTQSGQYLRIGLVRLQMNFIASSKAISIMAQEEIKLVRAGCKCFPVGEDNYVRAFHDSLADTRFIVSKTHIMVWAGLELIESYSLEELGIVGNVIDVHRIGDKTVIVTDEKVYAYFGEARFDRYKSEYIDARGASLHHTMAIVGYTDNDTFKQMVYQIVKPGTIRRLNIRWYATGDEFIPYKNGSAIEGNYAFGNINCMVSRTLDGVINVVPDYNNADEGMFPNAWTTGETYFSYKSQAGFDAQLKLRDEGWYVEVKGINGKRIVWRIDVLDNLEGSVKIPVIQEPTPGGNSYNDVDGGNGGPNGQGMTTSNHWGGNTAADNDGDHTADSYY